MVGAENLDPNTRFDLFLLQLPGRGGGPFGIASYEGDIETNAQGDGRGVFIGRFNQETFTISPNRGQAPVIHRDGLNPDAPTADDVTPFNGEHRAGIKALSTRNFPDRRGPLREVAP
jgi:hypothetical protein